MILGSLGAQLGTVDAQLGAVLFGGPVAIPDTEVQIITVEAQDRVIQIATSSRTVSVEADDRVILVPDVRGVL